MAERVGQRDHVPALQATLKEEEKAAQQKRIPIFKSSAATPAQQPSQPQAPARPAAVARKA